MLRDDVQRIWPEIEWIGATDLREKTLLTWITAFERSPLEKYLSSVGHKLDSESRVTILKYLADVVRADGRVSHFETDYFDMVAGALNATPSELVGLIIVEEG